MILKKEYGFFEKLDEDSIKKLEKLKNKYFNFDIFNLNINDKQIIKKFINLEKHLINFFLKVFNLEKFWKKFYKFN